MVDRPEIGGEKDSRRRFLSLIAGSTTSVGLAGCSSDDSSDIQDSDNDGVIDSEDYAPNDPEVQDKSDLEDDPSTPQSVNTATRTGTVTATSTPQTGNSGEETTQSPTSTTTSTSTPTSSPTPSPTPTATPTPETNTISVSEDNFTGVSYITQYSLRDLSAMIRPTDPDLEGYDLNRMNLYVQTQRFPGGEVISWARSSDTPSTTTSKSLSVNQSFNSVPKGDPLYHSVYLLSEDVSPSEAESEDFVYIHESDPFRISQSGERLEKLGGSSIPELGRIESDSGRYHERRDVEGGVYLIYEGQTNGESWVVDLYIFKAAYVDARRRDHGRSRPEFVSYEMSYGLASTLAPMLNTAAEQNGFSGKREKVEFVIDFVQFLPYVPDDVSRGFDDITLYSIETIAEGNGDCEDTSVLLASVLQSEPFNYDMILIRPPGHMAAGILGSEDVPGTYWTVDGNRYYYIETTGVGWGIGDLPEEYEGESAYTYQV